MRLGDFRFSSAFGKTLSRLIRMGVGVHHAGMLPRYRRLVETLTQQGLLKVVCGTDTLGVGINVPIRTVLFSGLSKYDGTRQRQLQVREFQQIAGRAGRAGYDTIGHVVVEAPEHEIENARLVRKAGDDPKKLQARINRKKPPEGFVSWGEGTFEKLSTGTPEPLVSRMRVSHAMVLDVISRPGDARASLERLLRESGETEESQDRLLAEVDEIIEALLAGEVVEPIDPPDARGSHAAADDRPAGQLRAQPAAVAVRRRSARAARPRVADVRARRRVGRRGDARRPATDRQRAAAPRPRRGDQRDEDGRHRVRRADGAARGDHPPQAAGGAADRGVRDVPRSVTRGSPTTSCSPSRSCARCGSGP